MSSGQQSTAIGMRSFEDLLAASSWAQSLTPEQLQRVRTTTVVRDFAAEADVCHAGDPANVWVGVVDGLVRMVSSSPAGKSMGAVSARRSEARHAV